MVTWLSWHDCEPCLPSLVGCCHRCPCAIYFVLKEFSVFHCFQTWSFLYFSLFSFVIHSFPQSKELGAFAQRENKSSYLGFYISSRIIKEYIYNCRTKGGKYRYFTHDFFAFVFIEGPCVVFFCALYWNSIYQEGIFIGFL